MQKDRYACRRHTLAHFRGQPRDPGTAAQSPAAPSRRFRGGVLRSVTSLLSIPFALAAGEASGEPYVYEPGQFDAYAYTISHEPGHYDVRFSDSVEAGTIAYDAGYHFVSSGLSGEGVRFSGGDPQRDNIVAGFAYVPKMALSITGDEPLEFEATGYGATVVHAQGSALAAHLDAADLTLTNQLIAPLSAYAGIEADMPPVEGFADSLTMLYVDTPLRVTENMHLRFEREQTLTQRGANLFFGQDGVLVLDSTKMGKGALLSIGAGAELAFGRGSGIAVVSAEDTLSAGVSAGGGSLMLAASGLPAATAAPATGAPDDNRMLPFFMLENGASVTGLSNAAILFSENGELVTGHLERIGNTVVATRRRWEAKGPYGELAGQIRASTQEGIVSGARSALSGLLLTPEYWTAFLHDSTLKGSSLGTSQAMRDSLGFSLTDFMTSLGDESFSLALVSRADREKDDEKERKRKAERSWIPSFGERLNVRLIGERSRAGGRAVNMQTLEVDRLDIRRRSTGFELILDRDYAGGMRRWGARLAYRNSDIRSENRRFYRGWHADSDVLTARGYWAAALTDPQQWLVIHAGYAQAGDVLDAQAGEHSLRIPDITRRMWQAGLSHHVSDTELIPGLQLWRRTGVSLIAETAADYGVTFDGEEIFRVREERRIAGRLEAGGGILGRFVMPSHKLRLTLRTALEGALYAGSRRRGITASAGGADAHDSTLGMPRWEGVYTLGAQLNSKLCTFALSAGVRADSEHTHSREISGTFFLEF